MRGLANRLLFIAVGLFMAAPLVVIAGVSLNEKRTLTFPPQGLSLRWYGDIFTDDGWRAALTASVTVAALAAALSVLIALPIAYALWRRTTRLGRLIQLMGVSPFVLPPVITALGALSFWITAGFYGRHFTVVISHAIFFTSLPLVTLTLGFATIDKEMVEASRSMGANERTVLSTIVLPMIAPYLISGFAFAFVLSLNEYIVAYMTEQLQARSNHRVLEVGTGSGYQAAVLSRLAREVISIERYRTLADAARARLKTLAYNNVEVISGDGFAGEPSRAPFDRIIVTAAAESVPQALTDQLAEDGIMVIPLGPPEGHQELARLTKTKGGWLQRDNLIPVRFVPLLPGKAREL